MAQINILNLPVAIALDGTEYVALQRIAQATQRATSQQIANLGGEQSIQSLLDTISSTQGAVLYRGASAWSALSPGTSGFVLTAAGAAANPSWAAVGGGTVTSVAMTVPTSILSVAGSPVTTTGTLAVTLATQTANTVFSGPTTGSAATPTFRALVAADLPGTVLTWGS